MTNVSANGFNGTLAFTKQEAETMFSTLFNSKGVEITISFKGRREYTRKVHVYLNKPAINSSINNERSTYCQIQGFSTLLECLNRNAQLKDGRTIAEIILNIETTTCKNIENDTICVALKSQKTIEAFEKNGVLHSTLDGSYFVIMDFVDISRLKTYQQRRN